MSTECWESFTRTDVSWETIPDGRSSCTGRKMTFRDRTVRDQRSRSYKADEVSNRCRRQRVLWKQQQSKSVTAGLSPDSCRTKLVGWIFRSVQRRVVISRLNSSLPSDTTLTSTATGAYRGSYSVAYLFVSYYASAPRVGH